MFLFERRNTMTNKAKLIDFIHNLTNEEAEYLIACLKTSSSFAEAILPVPPNTVQQEQEVAV